MKKQLSYLFIAILALGCKSKAVYHNDPVPAHDSININSKFVNENRVINIWKPANYKESSDLFPVLYMPDGGIQEDFPHIANTLAKLIETGEIPPILLVGIKNTERGRDLTGESKVKKHEKYEIPMDDGAKNFRAFITDELMPEINRQYRTNGKTGIIGESLAGLFVMETFFLQPSSFNFYIAMDPSLWWNDNYLVSNADSFLKNLPEGKKTLWFAGSNTTDISQYTNQLAKLLRNKPLDELRWKYADKPNEKHSTIFRATKENALVWALNE